LRPHNLSLAQTPSIRRFAFLWAWVSSLALASTLAGAQPANQWSLQLEESVKRHFHQQNSTPPPNGALTAIDPARSAGTPSGSPNLQVEVSLGTLDSRLQLAPCGRIEPFLPTGARLWGRSVIGVRCLSGANWSITLPVQVTISGPALVASRSLNAGSMPSEQDFQLDFVELSREPGTPIMDIAQLKGKVLSRTLTTGQVLRTEHLRLLPSVNIGDPVQVKLLGEGFTLVYDGVALNAAADGQVIRVRAENGKVLSGQLRARSLQIQL
jgi:flagellar basal body P-ring formation protein FlgA